jgi:biopolymer transport protein ExbB
LSFALHCTHTYNQIQPCFRNMLLQNLSVALLLLQAPGLTPASDVSAKSVSLLGSFVGNTTSSMVMFVILAILSIAAVYIILERYATITRAGKIDQNFMNSIRTSVESGNLQAARALCQSVNSPMARMVEKGLDRIGKPLEDINKAIENVGNLELLKLERNLSTLASISGLGPMFGLLGTVLGLILSFQDMSTATNVTPQVLSGGIYQALTSTAMGLIVSIVSMAGYNLLVSNLDKVVYKMEYTALQFMDLLQEPSR